MSFRRSLRAGLPALCLLSVAGCEVGPEYVKPTAPTPAVFKEQAGWKPSEPQDALDRGLWWGVYKDPVLDDLEKQIDISNQTLKEADAAYREARAVVDATRAGYFPTISADGSFTRSHSGGGSSRANSSLASISGIGAASTTNSISPSVDASWAPDIWGKIGRTVEGDIATAQASAADLASARLSAQGTLASDYFELRYQEELKRLLDTTVKAYQQSLKIAQNQYAVGVAAKADVLSAQTQVINAQAAAINAGVMRATLEHAIAVLIGKPPADFTIKDAPFPTDVPVVPAGLPSELLERRPDIAAAERQMAAASAQIGVAIAAYFPTLTLSASDGFTSSTFSHLFSSPNSVWSLGATAADSIFDAGLRSAQVEQARAAFDQNIANYRQTVLAGFQQVEDELATLRILAEQSAVEQDAVNTAREATRLTLNQYKAGTVPYSSVITAQATELATEETQLSVNESRLVASVTLIEAIGGGWNAAKLPRDDQVEDNAAFLHVIPISTEHPTSSDGSTPPTKTD